MTNPSTNGWQAMVIVMPSMLPFLTATVAAVLAYLSKLQSTSVEKQVQELHLTVNSRLNALLDTARQLARAEGVVAGTAAERADQSDCAALRQAEPKP